MTRALLLVPHFWDPVCVPLGISSLKAFAETHGHEVRLCDLNTNPAIFGCQRAYFNELRRQFPRWKKWNAERNATEVLSLHQVVYLKARGTPHYAAMVAEILNVLDEPIANVLSAVDVERFDVIFDRLFAAARATIAAQLEQVRPEVFGVSLYNSTWAGTLFAVSAAKQCDPSMRTVVGGPGPIMGLTADPREVAAFHEAETDIDFFVVGEGEGPFLEILEEPRGPRGIRQGRAAKGRHMSLAEIPPPNYGELDVDRYLQLSVASSRGCPFECSFCAETVFWNGFRKSPSSQLFRTIDVLAQRHHRGSFYVCDSLSNATIGPLTDWVAREQKSYQFDCYLRADKSCIDSRKTASWKAGGLYRARLGMESASQRILDEMVKMTTPQLMSRSLQALASAGIMTSTLWVVCYPGETQVEFEQTLQFIREHRHLIYQSDAWLFQYHQDGLANSGALDRAFGSHQRFSDPLNDLLHVTPYRIARDIPAAERFARLEKFVDTMAELGVPNPYSVFQWHHAERRWRDLGRDAGWSMESSIVALNG